MLHELARMPLPRRKAGKHVELALVVRIRGSIVKVV